MTVSSGALLVSLAWLLAMTAALGHGAINAVGRKDVGWGAVAFAVTLAAGAWLAPGVEWAAGLVGLLAVWQLLRPVSVRLSLAMAGASAALAASLYATHGAPEWAAAAASLVLVLFGLTLARDERFVRPGMRQALFIVVAWTAPLLAATPGVTSGWQAAMALNRSLAGGSENIPLWALGLAAAAVSVGLARGFWVRR